MKHLLHDALLFCIMAALPVEATNYYVDSNQPDDSESGLSWSTAKKTIQAAVNSAASSDTIYVAAGTYIEGATITPGYSVSNRVYVSKAITIEAVDGPELTMIAGTPATGGDLGTDATRGMFVGNVNAHIIGFTFTNGYTSASGNFHDSCGGGLCADNYSSVVISNCIFIHNKAYSGGGFSGWGTAYDCSFIQNTATGDGGGANAALTAYDCLFTNNTASQYGGGSSAGTMYRCTFVSNHANSGGGMINGIVYDCVFDHNSAATGGGKYYGQAYDCTFINNTVSYYGGGTYEGIVTDCIISNNTAKSGGGAANGKLSGCLIINNRCSDYGGGMAANSGDYATNCTFRGNNASYGGGMYNGDAYNCDFIENSCYYQGGGIRSTTAKNCLISGNTSRQQGGGTYQSTVANCTITANSAEYSGGGAYQGTLNNSIAWYNSAPDYPNIQSAGANYTCSPAVSHGSNGCITNEPLMASHSHLQTGSPCIGAGSVNYLSGSDLDGDPWGSPPPMGCDEPDSIHDGLIDLNLSISATEILTGMNVTITSVIIGQCSRITLDLDDGTVLTNALGPISRSWATSGTKQIVLTAYNDNFPSGISIIREIKTSTMEEAAIRVAPTGNDANDGSSWALAKATIQAGIDAQAFPGGSVLVSNGTYVLSERIQVNKDITVRSLSGPAQTIVDGNGVTGCFYLDDVLCSLEGFTITNGYESYDYGAGVFCYDIHEQVVSNCIITGNINEDSDGGGMYYGIAIHCIFDGNRAPEGYGGGLMYGRAYNCLFINNSAYYGGGASDCELTYCTVAANAAEYEGGGTYYGYMTNCIVWNNTSTNYGDRYPNAYGTDGMYSCCSELEHGEYGCITNAPLFACQNIGNYRLSAGSPCIDTGTNLFMVVLDLDGNARLAGARSDMGAYEYSGEPDSDADGLPDSWESEYYGNATNAVPSAMAANGINTIRECYTADIDPTNPEARFVILELSNGELVFDSSENRSYLLLMSTNLPEGVWLPIEGPRSGAGTNDTMTAPATLPHGYYRLQVEVP
ncbi:MAG: hypothetical protein JXR25_09585 [Pontiellaceae bacterium]|nr:hypothetical protein [Pontiellaceae bacterium]MBN2785068.1 hypothetical protein [Pontiellaceae bacterium]